MYEVQTITDRRINPATQKTEYLVKWAGHPTTNNSWEPEQNLYFVQYLIEQFNKKSTGQELSQINGKEKLKKPDYFDDEAFESAKGQIFEESEDEGQRSPGGRSFKKNSDRDGQQEKKIRTKKRQENRRDRSREKRKSSVREQAGQIQNLPRTEQQQQTQNPFSKLPPSFHSFNKQYLQNKSTEVAEKSKYLDFSPSLELLLNKNRKNSRRQQIWEQSFPKKSSINKYNAEEMQPPFLNSQVRLRNNQSRCIPSHFCSREGKNIAEYLFDAMPKFNSFACEQTTATKNNGYVVLEILNMERAGGQYYYLSKTTQGNLWLQRKDVFPMYATQLCQFYEKNLTFENP